MNPQSQPSRRSFLKGSAGLLAGAAVAANFNVSRMAHAAGSDVLKVALIGCGGRGSGAAQNLLNVPNENIKIVAVADAFEDKARKSAENLRKHKDQVDISDDRVFFGLDAYKKAIDCGVDMVILATPPGFRPMQYMAAVQAGKNVFMEKPCCTDAPGYRLLLEANKIADEKNLKVGVGLQRHHQPGYQETVKRIHDGAIGRILFLRAQWNGSSIWYRPRTKEMTEMQYQVTNWYHFVAFSGDNICEQHVHNLDICNWVMNDHPIEANGMGGCTQRYLGERRGQGQIFDHHFVEFTYKDGAKMYSQCRHIPNTMGGVFESAHGTEGSSNCSSTISDKDGKNKFPQVADAKAAQKAPEKGAGKHKRGQGGMSPYDQEHIDLVKAIRSNDKYNEGHYGADSSFTAVLGRMATYSGQSVKWDDAVKFGPAELPETLAWDALPKALPDKNGDYPIPMPGVYKAYVAQGGAKKA
jgi:hypothetical protein